jgi:hypothetical protein
MGGLPAMLATGGPRHFQRKAALGGHSRQLALGRDGDPHLADFIGWRRRGYISVAKNDRGQKRRAQLWRSGSRDGHWAPS